MASARGKRVIRLPPNADITIHLQAVALMKSRMVKGATMEGVVLQFGRRFTARELPAAIRPGRPRACFANSLALALNGHPGLPARPIYCEGFALAPEIPFPIHHGWCCDQAGNVIDVTWKEPQRCQYYGIPLQTMFIAKHRCSVLDDGAGRMAIAPDRRSLLSPLEWLQQLNPAPERRKPLAVLGIIDAYGAAHLFGQFEPEDFRFIHSDLWPTAQHCWRYQVADAKFVAFCGREPLTSEQAETARTALARKGWL